MAVTSKASNQLMTKADVIELINNAVYSYITGSGQTAISFLLISALNSTGARDTQNKVQFQGSNVGVNSISITVDGDTHKIV